MRNYNPETQCFAIHESQLYRLEKAAHALRAIALTLEQSSNTAVINPLDLAAMLDYPAADLAAICKEVGDAQ